MDQRTLSAREHIPVTRLLGLAAGIGFAILLAIERILPALRTTAGQLPSQSPGRSRSPWSSDIYANMLSSRTTAVVPQLVPMQLDERRVRSVEPYQQLEQWSSAGRTWTLIALSVVGVVFAIGCRRFAHMTGLWGRVVRVTQILALVGAGCSLGFAVVVHSLNPGWDEVFVFASQASNVAERGFPAVSITGPHAYGESSADAAATVGAGLLMIFDGSLRPESALVIGYFIGVALLVTALVLMLRRWWLTPLPVSVCSAMLAIILLPEHLSTSASGTPVMVASAGLAVLGLALLRSYERRDYLAAGVATIVAGAIRWEFSLVGLAGIALSVLVPQVRVPRAELSRRLLVPFGLAGGFFAIASVARHIAYGSMFPSGAIAKSVGIDGAYLANAFSYLLDVSNWMAWPFVIAFCIVIGVGVTRSTAQMVPFVLTSGVLSVPLITALLAGGDWFTISWARYVLPSVIAIAFSTVAVASRNSVDAAPHQRASHRLALLIAAPAVLFLASIPVLGTVIKAAADPPSPGRTNCLARVGVMLRDVLPPGVGVASAEVNTVAYFADQPLTDLVGLVDSRVAAVPPTPKVAGDVLHRRSNPSVIESDRPGAIYLFEGARCPLVGSGLDYNTIQETWEGLLDNEFTRYRAGPADALLASYAPITLASGGDAVFILIRKDLVSAVTMAAALTLEENS